ncbi:TetR family transcriptional regulator [Agarivorans sp. Toyoura001]|uniref:TetR/AcrR family transcriptional regulator n=1 Tax=Agarivorans sp. Toyoura001 TaxID=2283141 RepID=UPI0010CF586A|nr:TetR/AcrR family transcriptional regulator [Agarivorans sp. Toyoura001]GDY28066.1 TetR family transcriptional regulator [Agarivorans sp. Toyoura001]
MAKATATQSGAIRKKNEKVILKAATNEFVKHGYQGTSLQAIADRAELPKANILYYFKSKQGLYRALLEDILAMWNDAFEHTTADDDPAVAISAYIRSKMRYSRSHPKSSRIFAMEIIQGAPNLKDNLQFPVIEWSKQKCSLIQTWIDQGKIQPIEPIYLLFLIWGATQFYADFDTEVRMIHGKALSVEEFSQAEQNLVDIILRGIGLTS